MAAPGKKALAKLIEQKAQPAPRESAKQVNLYETEPEKKQTSKEAKKQTNKDLKKFGTWLHPETMRRLKVFAALAGQHDYEIVEAAILAYLAAHAGEIGEGH